MGVKAPECFSRLGTVLSLLYRLGSCWWGCRGDDHAVEYVIARAASSARGAMRLMRLGFYDEALALIRGVGVVANVVLLFAVDGDAEKEWRLVDDRARRERFSALQVRLRLERSGQRVPVAQERYAQLSAMGTHAGPHTTPQSFNVAGVALAPGCFQQAGVLLILNELALAVAFVAVSAARIRGDDPVPHERITDAACELVESIGGVTVTDLERLWDHVRPQQSR